MNTLSIDQAQYLLTHYKDHKIYLPVALAILTGMRLGEICGVCWSDVDLTNNSISVTHTLQRQNGVLILKEPKTRKSIRSIPITTDLVKILKSVKHQANQNQLAQAIGYDRRGFVCAWDDGRPFDPDWVSKQWRKIITDDKEVSEKDQTDRHFPDGVRFHDLRHTHASILLSQGLNIKIVQERLGHESITTTGDVYSHVTPAMSQEANNILESVFRLSG